MPSQYPFIDGLRWSWSNFRAPDLLKWSALLTLANIAFSVLERASGYSLVKYFLAGFTPGAIPFGFDYFFISWLIMFSALLVSLFISARAMMSAMAVTKVKTAKSVSFLGWAWMQAWKTVINFSCWYDRKLLAPAAALAFLALIAGYMPFGYSGIIAFAIFCLAVFAWLMAALIHSARTSFAVYMFLEGERDSIKVVENSDRMVRGRTVEVFLAQMLAMAALLIPLFLVNLLTGIGVGFIFSGTSVAIPYDAGLALFLAGFALSVFTLALQQALSANIWAFFKKAGGHKLI